MRVQAITTTSRQGFASSNPLPITQWLKAIKGAYGFENGLEYSMHKKRSKATSFLLTEVHSQQEKGLAFNPSDSPSEWPGGV